MSETQQSRTTVDPGGLQPGPLGEATTVDRIEVRVTGQPDPVFNSFVGAVVLEFPPYDFTFRSDSDNWQYAAGIAHAATTKWTNGRVEMRRVRIETRVSDWAPIDAESLATPEVTP